MTSPFNTLRDSTPGSVDQLTLVNGRTFLVAAADGSLTRPSHGVVFEDLRMLSRFQVDVGTAAPSSPINVQLLGVSAPTPFHAVFVSRPDPDAEDDRRELYVHRQWIGRGVRHDIELHNTGDSPIRRTITIGADTDFAHVFDMKAGHRGTSTTRLDWDGRAALLSDVEDDAKAVEICAQPRPTRVDDETKQLVWQVDCRPDEVAVVSVSFEPCWDGQPAGIAFPIGTPPSQAWPATRLEHWRRVAPAVVTDDARLSVAVDASVADLASLRIFDRHHAERVVVAAGAPWFMTLFGRDSLLTSWMVLPFLPELAVGTIDTLAALQGTVEHPETEEEPGKILHELRRHGGDAAFADRGRYFGTVDATPLFVMVVAEAARWGHLPHDELLARWPSVRAAVEWVRRGIARGGGFLRYRRSTGVGLMNQGWKDSWDGVNFADGRLADGPIALAEVQGYAYAALGAAGELTDLLGDTAGADAPTAESLRREAHDLAERFESAFWMEAADSYAIAIDGADRQVDAVTTNPGHAIWCGVTDPARADRYLDRIADDLFSGWGLRTLSPTCARYDPLSYHNGSVWPHDTAIVAAGAARLGRHDLVDRLLDAALDVAARTGGRPPELFAGVDRSVIDIPVPYPSSCSPQAWSSASVLLHLRSALGLEPPPATGGPPTLGAGDGPDTASVAGIRVGPARFTAARNPTGWQIAPEPATNTRP